MSLSGVLIAIIVSSLVTLLTRAVPFLLLSRNREIPPQLLFVARRLPVAVISILLFYSMMHISFDSYHGWLKEVISTAIVVILHLLRRNTLLSVLLGTLSYMILTSLGI